MKVDQKLNKAMLDFIDASIALANAVKKDIMKTRNAKDQAVLSTKTILALNTLTVAANEIDGLHKQLEKSIDFFNFN